MESKECYEDYPFWIVISANLVAVSVYTIGALVIYQVGVIWLVLYLLYVLFLEVKLLRASCIHCYYYGRCCAFGKGKLSSLLFKKGDSNKFSQKQVTWKDMIPDLMVSIIPIIVGIVL